jgi:hypothetical protein
VKISRQTAKGQKFAAKMHKRANDKKRASQKHHRASKIMKHVFHHRLFDYNAGSSFGL